MKKLVNALRAEVYDAPIINWNNDSYTPISNKLIIDLIDKSLLSAGLIVRDEEYRVSRDANNLIKGVVGSYNITTSNKEFGQRVMFRNSYDKSMSFAFVCGMCVWICTNGCIKGDYQYKRIHRGVLENNTSTTEQDVVESINSGIANLQESFECLLDEMEELRKIQISPKDVYDLLGNLFFEQEVISINQMSIIKKELAFSDNFRHLGDTDFTAFDLYNHITESLKSSHPTTYIKDHMKTHDLFESTFSLI